MNFEDLKNPELQEKLKTCRTAEELVVLAKAEGFELSDAELESVSGGAIWDCSDNICADYRGPELDPDPGWN